MHYPANYSWEQHVNILLISIYNDILPYTGVPIALVALLMDRTMIINHVCLCLLQ